MPKKMTWTEMKKKYPNQWLVVTDFTLDKYGQVLTGFVAQHSKKTSGINENPIIDRATEIRYTGEFTFNGVRSHATHDHSI